MAFSSTLTPEYRYWRIRILYSSFIGYALYYFTRGTLSIAMPELKSLGFDEVWLGWMVSSFQISYGISKFVSGIQADRSNPRYFMAFGLIATGVANFLFGLSSSVLLFILFWTLNGWFQGWGSAPCHRLLTYWYARSERGRWWSVWNTSHNVGAALLPILASYCIMFYNWRAGFFAASAFALLGGFFLMNRLRDTPQSLGLEAIETVSGEEELSHARHLSIKEILFQYIFPNRALWVIGVVYLLVYIVRWSLNHWCFHYLVDAKGYEMLSAGYCITAFELGGFVGGIAAGWLSDIFFKGRRGVVNLLFLLMMLPCISLFWYASTNLSPGFTQLALALVGFCIFGPQMLLAVHAVELTPKNAAATSVGFLGIIAYIGCSVTGGPLGHLIKDGGWQSYYYVLLIGTALAAVALIPIVSRRMASRLANCHKSSL